jgi:hypothetical protein
MSYIINKSDGSVLLSIQDGDLDTSTSLGLLGRNYTGYGEVQNENFIFLLENFANTNPPARPVKGQTWFNSSINVLNAYTGTTWTPVGAATPQETPPPEVIGAFWLKTTTEQLYVFTETGWELVGPQLSEGFAKTRAESTVLTDVNDINHPVILFYNNGGVEAICTSTSFTIALSNTIPGFLNLLKGINISSNSVLQGELTGNSATTTRLKTARTINNVSFDGTANIIITSNTNNSLIRGDYLLGNNFNGSNQITWSADASSDNLIGKLVARDSSGNFSAQEITAVAFNGTLAGNVNATSGTSFFNRILSPLIEGQTYTGNAASSTKLNPGRFINGVLFDGTANITVSAAAGTLTGDTINSNVLNSSLRTVGTLNSLSVADAGISVGTGNTVKILSTASQPKITGDGSLEISVEGGASIKFVQSVEAIQQGGPSAPAILSNDSSTNIGGPTKKFDKVYANSFIGNADSATQLTLGRTINGILFNGTQNIIIADNTKLPLVGGTISGNVTVTGKITLPQAPTVGTDAVNKTYVDTLVNSRPLFFSLDIRGLSTTGSGPGSVVSILNAIAPPAGIAAGTLCRVAGTVQNVTANYAISTTSASMPQRITSVSLTGTTTVQNPTRNNDLVYQVNSAKTSWQYVSG